MDFNVTKKNKKMARKNRIRKERKWIIPRFVTIVLYITSIVSFCVGIFGISNDVAMQVVGVGFIIGVIQDSCETALNSSTDVLFTAAAEFGKRRLENK